MSTPTPRPSAQSRLTTKVPYAQYAPPQTRPAADPVLANIVARLKAEVDQQASGGDLRPVPGHVQQNRPVQEAVYDPFSRYHTRETALMGGGRKAPSQKVDRISTTAATTCVCNRPRQLVMCQHCGETFEGRVKLICPSHPSVTYLLDVVACKGCKMDNIEALREFPISSSK
jgi:hypothetical protein